MRGAAHLRLSCGLRAERAALQAALPRSGESAGAGGTGSERRAEGETGAPAAAGPSPTSKGEALGLSPLPPPHSLPRKARDSVPLPEYNLVCAPTGATWPRARHDHIV